MLPILTVSILVNDIQSTFIALYREQEERKETNPETLMCKVRKPDVSSAVVQLSTTLDAASMKENC